jgi:hypothetical protein
VVQGDRPDFKELNTGSIWLFMTEHHRAVPPLHLSAHQQKVCMAVQIRRVRDGPPIRGFHFHERVMLVLDGQRYSLEGDLGRELSTVVEKPELIFMAAKMGRNSAQESRVQTRCESPE